METRPTEDFLSKDLDTKALESSLVNSKDHKQRYKEALAKEVHSKVRSTTGDLLNRLMASSKEVRIMMVTR